MAKSSTAKKKPLSKSAVLQAVTEEVGEEISRKQVKLVVETLVEVIPEHRRPGVLEI